MVRREADHVHVGHAVVAQPDECLDRQSFIAFARHAFDVLGIDPVIACPDQVPGAQGVPQLAHAAGELGIHAVIPGSNRLIERERVSECAHAAEILTLDTVIARANQHVERHVTETETPEICDIFGIDAVIAGTHDIVG